MHAFVFPGERLPGPPPRLPAFRRWLPPALLCCSFLGLGGLGVYAHSGQNGAAMPQPGPRRYPPAYRHRSDFLNVSGDSAARVVVPDSIGR